jgi:hypothetical protein
MLVLNRSLLNKEYILINVLKALASIISICNLHVTFLSRITPRYFTLSTSEIFHPFNVRWDSGGRRLREKYIPRVLSSVILTIQRSHQVSIELRPGWSFLTTKTSLRSVAYRQVMPAKRARWTPCVWGPSFMYILKGVGDKTVYCFVFVGRPLWREDGSLFCICFWPSPAPSFSGPSPFDLATIF